MERHYLQWHITHRCNLRCTHCYQEEYQEVMSGDLTDLSLERYLRYLEYRGMFGQVNLTGGEPLTHPEFWELSQKIRSHGLELGVLTNGTMIGHAEALMLKDLKPVFVQVSLDGTRKTHDAVRGEGSFDQAMAGIRCLKRVGVHVLVSFTAQKNNFRDFPKLAAACRAARADKLWWDRVVSNDTEHLALDTSEFEEMSMLAAKARKRYQRRDGSSMVNCGRALQFLATGRPCRYRCRPGDSVLVLLADGSLMPCRRLPFIIGKITDGEIASILDQSTIVKQLANPLLPEACTQCEHRLTCGGGARCVTYAQTGRLDVRDVNCRHC